MNCRLERLTRPVSDGDYRALAELLVDAVESGAAVSFLVPLAVETAETWWRRMIDTSNDRAIFLVARDDDQKIVGSVQLHPAWAPISRIARMSRSSSFIEARAERVSARSSWRGSKTPLVATASVS